MNNRIIGQAIGLLLLVAAVVYGGVALGSGDSASTEANTAPIEVSTANDEADRPDSGATDGGDESSADVGPDVGTGNASTDDVAPVDPPLESRSGLPPVSVDDLPDEAFETLLLIDSDGPYPYDKDGSTFQNREGLLPDEDRGYYREFTVDTPGLDHRGARRIVGGDGGELYWTSDHYDSFSEIVDW